MWQGPNAAGWYWDDATGQVTQTRPAGLGDPLAELNAAIASGDPQQVLAYAATVDRLRNPEAFEKIMQMQAQQAQITPNQAAGWETQAAVTPAAEAIGSQNWDQLNAQSQAYEDAQSARTEGFFGGADTLDFLKGAASTIAGGYLGPGGGMAELLGGVGGALGASAATGATTSLINGGNPLLGAVTGAAGNVAGGVLGGVGDIDYSQMGGVGGLNDVMGSGFNPGSTPGIGFDADSLWGASPRNQVDSYGPENSFDLGDQTNMGGGYTPQGPYIGDELNPPDNMTSNPGPYIGDDLNPPNSLTSLNQDRMFYGMPTGAADQSWWEKLLAPAATSAVSSAASGVFGPSGGVNGNMLGAALGALAGSMGGQKQAGTTTTTTDVPEWLKPYYTDLLSKGQAQTNQAPADYTQSDAAMQNIMGGGSIQAPTFNPYGGSTTPQTANGYIGQTVTPGTNQYLGQNNPFFEGVLNKSLNDTQGRVNNQFRNSAFGGSANQELLARNLGDQSNSMRYGEYNQQMQLSEADIARKLQSQQADMARNSSLAQNQGQFNSNLYANDLTRNAALYNTDATRNQNAFQFGQTQAANAATNMPQYQAQKNQSSFQPLLNQKSLLSTGGSQSSSPYYTNPTGGALYGGLLGSQLFGGK